MFTFIIISNYDCMKTRMDKKEITQNISKVISHGEIEIISVTKFGLPVLRSSLFLQKEDFVSAYFVKKVFT